MRATSTVVLSCVGSLLLLASSAAPSPVGTAFTHQGRLTDGGSPASGFYDLQFTLYDAVSGGAQVGSTLVLEDVRVSNGLFTVSLDFGASAFAGEGRWLEVGTRPGASTGSFTILSPRQELTPSPNAVFSQKAPWAGLAGVPAGFADGTDNDLLGGLSCSNGQIAKWNGAAWGCATDADSGGDITEVIAGAGLAGGGTTAAVTLNANLAGSGAASTLARSDHDHFGATWSGTTNPGLLVSQQSADSIAVYGFSSGAGVTKGVYGSSTSPEGRGVYGLASAASGFTYGVRGESSSSDGTGVSGVGATGLRGESSSSFGTAVLGQATAGTGTTYGVYGEASSTSGRGVVGFATAGSGDTRGVWGLNLSTAGQGVYGVAFAPTGTTYGVRGESSSSQGTGVYGLASALTSDITYGVRGESSSSQGTGVYGLASALTSNITYGVRGESPSSQGIGVYGLASATLGATYGVYGEARSDDISAGVYGIGLVHGVHGKSTWGGGVPGVLGEGGYGVTGVGVSVGVYGNGSDGVHGQSTSLDGRGVYGRGYNSAGVNYGVYGETNAPAGWAGYFLGRVAVTGTLFKGGGSFRIDHPLDPENKYLYHSFVESPDMMNIYNGNVTTDERGYAVVTLPDWFEALNRDFRYQLTVLDEADNAGFVQAKVVKKIAGNRFTIRTSAPWTEVSWQVTGIRQDAFAEKHRIPVEEDKPDAERGLFLHPEEHGQPKEKGLDYQRNKDRLEPLPPPAERILEPPSVSGEGRSGEADVAGRVSAQTAVPVRRR